MYKYDKIINFIKNQINIGNIKPGKKLPSIRLLSEMFKCSNGTVIKAFSILEQQHIIYSKPKSGYYVIEGKPIKDKSNNKIIQASTSYPDIRLFPYNDFRHCMIQAINSYKEDLFFYTDPRGLPPLLHTMKFHLEDYQIFTKLNNLFITTGSQQAIDLLTKMPFPNGNNTILTEQPTYYGALRAFKLNNMPTIGIDRGFNGIDLDELENKFKKYKLKFFYTTPRLHNPIGYSYSKKEITSILYLAKKYNVYILEDDYMADFIDSTKLLPIYSYDSNDMVINLKSFSKILLPGLRISSMVLPKALLDTFSEYKKWADVNSTIISQGALEIFIKNGMFNTHKEKMKSLYSNRMHHLIEILEENIDENLVYSKPTGGYFLCIFAKNGTHYNKILTLLNSKNIKLVDTRVCFLENHKNTKYFRLSVSKMDERTINITIPEIVKTISENVIKKRDIH